MASVASVVARMVLGGGAYSLLPDDLGEPAAAGDVISADFTSLQWFDLPAVCVSDHVTA